MLRQAISVSINKLRHIADELEQEDKDSLFPCNNLEQKWSIPIINKQPECSDTWEFEGDKNAI